MKIIKEGKVFDLNAEEEEIKTAEVSTDVSDKAKVEDKDSFEQFKELYKGQIDEKCIQDYGSADNTKLWEDTAKEMFLASQDYIPEDTDKSEGDLVEKKTESKELKEEKELSIRDQLIALKNSKSFETLEKDPKDCGLYGFVSNNYYKMSTEQLKEIALDAIYVAENDTEIIDEYIDRMDESKEIKTENNAIDFVELVDKLKALDLWDGKDETFADAVKKYRELKETEKQLNKSKNSFNDNEIRKAINKIIKRNNGIFTDDSKYDVIEELTGIADIGEMPEGLWEKVDAIYETEFNKIESKEIKIEDHQLYYDDIQEMPTSERHLLWKQYHEEDFEDSEEGNNKFWDWAEEEFPVKELNESKLQEDQYENERRKGRPNINKIAQLEYYDNEDWYKKHINDYKDYKDFEDRECVEIAAEYNLSGKAGNEVCKEIYRLATEANKEVKTESQVSNYTLGELKGVLKDAGNDFKIQISGSDSKTKWLNVDKEDVKKIYAALSSSGK